MATKSIPETTLIRRSDSLAGTITSFLASRSRTVADSRLVAEVDRALRAVGCPEFRELQLSVEDGCITLQGRVHTYYLKQLAQATAMSVEGIQRVENEIVVA